MKVFEKSCFWLTQNRQWVSPITARLRAQSVIMTHIRTLRKIENLSLLHQVEIGLKILVRSIEVWNPLNPNYWDTQSFYRIADVVCDVVWTISWWVVKIHFLDTFFHKNVENKNRPTRGCLNRICTVSP